MWIEILLLAELAQGPRHGYELRREIEAATGHTLSNNSLYPRLRQFVESQAVLRRAEEHEGAPPRHVYSITDVGRELLHDLLAELPEDTADNGREFMARLVHFGWLTPEEQLRILDTQDYILARKRDGTAALAAARDEYWSRRALDHGIQRIDAERAWLASVRAEIQAKTAAEDAGRSEDGP
ncbi:PadR family transcriptional regulator [Streptomyces sp. NPDC046862]|uniref:PadR family transcriptional regulator n=1 Tax=Streptomyces sp. NPDC046862 TaxID=3154603 RepID=UPI0034523C34